MNPQQITAMREGLGLSQAQLAQLLGVHPITVSKWERGVSAPTAHQLAMLESFKKAKAAQPDVGAQVANLLVSAGVALAIFALLQAAFGRKK